MWPMPPETWEDIIGGKIVDTSGLFMTVETAIRLLFVLRASIVWNGSEGGTPRKIVYDDEIADGSTAAQCDEILGKQHYTT